MIHEAIYQLYPTVKQIQEDASGNYIARDVDSNEVAIDMSAVNTKAAELQTEEDNKVNVKASAKAKLIAGEALTEEEADTIVL